MEAVKIRLVALGRRCTWRLAYSVTFNAIVLIVVVPIFVQSLLKLESPWKSTVLAINWAQD